MSIVVLCPSRDRPTQAQELVASFRETIGDPGSRLVFIVDADDATGLSYPAPTFVIDPPPGCMNAALGAGTVKALLAYPEATIFGFVGDDHRFRTPGWDVTMGNFLRDNPGIGYANDLLQGINLPTMWFVSRPIVERFGMGHPGMRHLWIDNYWRELGEAAECLYYFPKITIEHMHPIAGKAQWDDNYRRVNSAEIADHDRAVFDAWKSNDLAADAVALQALLAGVVP